MIVAGVEGAVARPPLLFYRAGTLLSNRPFPIRTRDLFHLRGPRIMPTGSSFFACFRLAERGPWHEGGGRVAGPPAFRRKQLAPARFQRAALSSRHSRPGDSRAFFSAFLDRVAGWWIGPSIQLGMGFSRSCAACLEARSSPNRGGSARARPPRAIQEARRNSREHINLSDLIVTLA
jgi:hypothetical protein